MWCKKFPFVSNLLRVSRIDAEFWNVFLYLWRQSDVFSSLVYWYGELHWLIFKYKTLFHFQYKAPFGHDVLSFLCLYCFIWFAKITFITFASVFISNICLQFYFLVIFFVFGVRIFLASQNVLESIIYFPVFWESLYRIGVISLLIFGLAQKFVWVFL